MLSWLYKNRTLPGMPKAASAEPAAAKRRAALAAQKQAEEQTALQAAQRAAEKAELKAKEAEEARATWLPKLHAAQGDDAALLTVADAAPLLEIKLAAVEALVAEDALKRAERQFRRHDRRVHRIAKQRLEAAVAQRESRARAHTLIETASALTLAPLLAANHLVALDRDWQALDADLLEAAQRSEFDALREHLNALLRERGEREQRLQRWLATAARALADLQQGCVQAASNGHSPATDTHSRADGGIAFAQIIGAAQGLRDLRPDAPGSAAIDAALAAALHDAALIESRLAWLAALDARGAPESPDAPIEGNEVAAPMAPPNADAPSADAPSADAPSADAPNADAPSADGADAPGGAAETSAPLAPSSAALASTPAQRWQALPPLTDSELVQLMDQRFDAWQRAQIPVRAAAPLEARVQPASRAAAKRPSAEQKQRLETLLQQAEAALAEGQIGGLQHNLQAFDIALDTLQGGAPLSDSLRNRHQALQAEHARLKGWQQWGGGRARDELVAEAEKLAQLTLAAAPAQGSQGSEVAQAPQPSQLTPEPQEPQEPPQSPGFAPPAVEHEPQGRPVQAPAPARHAAHAPKLRLKEHGAAIQAMRKRWKELDRLGAAASQALWQRFDAALTIAHQPLAAQQAALKAARQENLAAREALLAALEAVPLAATGSKPDETAARWKEPLHALDHFHRAWRQLGPLEHTVPNSARGGLLERLRASVERIETPLHEARSAAEAGRERLIVRAQALAQELGAQPQMREAAARVRDLQAEWQQQARAVPLARGAENALWTRFKAATDAVFAQRDAAFTAREAELAANLAAREALLARLKALHSETPAAEIQRTLAEVDRAWRQPVELPRGAAGALDARLQDAHAAALKTLAASTQGHWQALCDTLTAKLALCEERESAPPDAADLAPRWAALAGLPAAWERALAQRWSAPAEPGPLPEVAMNDLLLQLETALDLPASPERLAARRDLKLRAMKDALEGRGTPNLDRRAEWLAAVLRQGGVNAAQRERLQALVAALRLAAPGTLVPTSTRG